MGWAGYPSAEVAYQEGYQNGFERGFALGKQIESGELKPVKVVKGFTVKVPRKQSKKQKILNEMAGVKWRKYKKGSGKKTYFDIRAEVTRSAIYKKKVKNL